MIMRRRPLMRGAMVAGVGYAAGSHAAKSKSREADQEQRIEELESQQQQPQQQYPPPPPPPPAAAAPSGSSMEQKSAELKELKSLLDAGILTQQEFDAQKQQILSR
ncbi:MAG: SHOCT domain-containing protein [Acidimicrobiales bacterium]